MPACLLICQLACFLACLRAHVHVCCVRIELLLPQKPQPMVLAPGQNIPNSYPLLNILFQQKTCRHVRRGSGGRGSNQSWRGSGWIWSHPGCSQLDPATSCQSCSLALRVIARRDDVGDQQLLICSYISVAVLAHKNSDATLPSPVYTKQAKRTRSALSSRVMCF